MSHKLFSLSLDVSLPDTKAWPRLLRVLIPTPGNVLFTLLVVASLLWAGNAGALPLRTPAAAGTSTGTIAYQGRLANADGNPLTGTYNMIFRLYDVASGGAPLWTEQWTGSNGVQVSDGLFNVMLGSLTLIPQDVITGHNSLFLGITVGTDDEMTPRVQLGSVPFAVQALTVPDGAITTAKIADGAVTPAKIATFPRYRSIHFVYDETGNYGRIGGDLGFRPNLMLDGGARKVGVKPGLDVLGNLNVSGTKSAVVQTGEHGQRKLYAVESPEVRFFDEGLARLKDGVGRVTLDLVFLETIEGEYLVHVTPYGDAGLYVAEVGEDYFVVKAREGDPDVAFAWRLSAHRKGYAGVRLEKVTPEQAEVAPVVRHP